LITPPPPPPPQRRNPLDRLVRIVRTRPRLFIAGLIGIVVGIFLPSHLDVGTRALVAWDIAVALYLVIVSRMMLRSDINRIRRRAAAQDEGRIAILGMVAAVALASLGAILVELVGAKAAHPSGWNLALAALTILLSWAFTHIIFALHYAHEYYDENAHKGGGLNFPGDTAPDYWDFVYFSFVIGMTSQVSDVAVTSPAIRRVVAAHGIMSFIFNATLLALTVNIAASAL
jgi:uncharacterized membrane protein